MSRARYAARAGSPSSSHALKARSFAAMPASAWAVKKAAVARSSRSAPCRTPAASAVVRCSNADAQSWLASAARPAWSGSAGVEVRGDVTSVMPGLCHPGQAARSAPESDDDQAIGRRFRTPDLAAPAEELADVGRAAIVGEGQERPGRKVEVVDGVRAEIGDPDAVRLVDIDGIRLGVARHVPLLPFRRRRVVAGELAGGPLGDPETAGRIGPHPPGAAARGRGIDDRQGTRRPINRAEVAPGERGEVDLAVGCRRDAVGSPPPGCNERLHPTGGGIQPAVDTALAGEPED